MLKTLAAANRSECAAFKIPRSVQQTIPIQRVYRDGIWQVNGKFSQTWRFADINYTLASYEDQKDMLKEAIVRAEEKCAALERDYEVAKKALDNSETYLEKLSRRYDRFVEWSDIYDTATIETKKMIVSQIIERVDVFRDYHLKIKFNISVEQFILGLDISA